MSEFQQNFRKDVISGLNKDPKSLPSKYFYDDEGSKIFREIMDMPEYYLPKAEFEIIQNHAEDIAQKMPCRHLDLVELGAGDGRKMVRFIQTLSLRISNLNYFPLDISEKALALNEQLIRNQAPSVKTKGFAGDYFETYSQFKARPYPKLVVFAGSNIGNFRKDESIRFLEFIKGGLREVDFFILGVDLKKNPKQIIQAYDDPQGITKRFNLNLLSRINTELDADFNLDAFDHYATYHPLTGACDSFLVSLENQSVKVGEEIFSLRKDEVIQTEISQKFDTVHLNELSREAGLRIDTMYVDPNHYFSWVLFKV
ncbi:MAG: L-histidine N(alpha)-methyltransferase [Cyclobacteriaceae bacterium]|nr:L-histidine N(alpha)-methyltransferase [Cyclobacteriaceae bacterium]MDX5467946.1 L-histidine N(alpha)-methyltransferase [Cyclobacteriaceae bacterium]